jgi:hypothetical protein
MDATPKGPVANIIRNILDQVAETTLTHAHFRGHVVTQAQLAALFEAVDRVHELEGVQTPTESVLEEPVPGAGDTPEALLRTQENLIRAERSQIAGQIKLKERFMKLAESSEKTKLNLELGELLSRRAHLDRLIQKLAL